MTKHEKQIIKVLKAMSDNTYDVAKTYEKDSVEYRYNMSACLSYDTAIRMIEDKKALQRRADIYSVDIENL